MTRLFHHSQNPTRPTARKVAYIVSRFPVVTETFILREILELERRGIQVEIFSLLRQREGVVHDEAVPLVARTCYGRLFSLAVLLAHLHFLVRGPRRYVRVIWEALRGNVSSRGFFARALFVLWQAPFFARQIERSGARHIHAHWATHPALGAFVVSRLTGLPYSFTTHAHDLYVERPMLGEKLDQASFVVTVSQFNRRLLEELYGGDVARKTVVVHCGVDPERFSPPTRLDLSTRPLQLLCVASLRDYKGHHYLLEACALLRDRGVPFQCQLAGEGEERPRLESQVAARGLQASVRLLGAQPEDRVRTLMQDSDVVVLPSIVTAYGKMEGIPVALMEALAAERAVVATRISGVPELVEDGVTGLLAPERDVEGLAQALERLARDPALRRDLGKAGRARVVQDFNLGHTTAALSRLLRHDWSTGLAALPEAVLRTPIPREEEKRAWTAAPGLALTLR